MSTDVLLRDHHGDYDCGTTQNEARTGSEAVRASSREVEAPRMSDDTASVNPARKPISRRLRFEILRRDNYTCRYCGASSLDAALTVDHVIPTALGGGDEPSNLTTACRDCNAGKASTSPDEHIVDDVDGMALVWKKAIDRAAEMQRVEDLEAANQITEFLEVWNHWHMGDDETRKIPMPTGWESSIRTFIKNGMDVNELHEMTHVAMESRATSDKTWRYFCGCCWNRLARRQEIARQLIEDGQL